MHQILPAAARRRVRLAALPRCLALALLPACALTVHAGDPERLGQDLTPLGAERGPNADGTIPAWQGAEAYPRTARVATAEDVRRLWNRDPAAYEQLLLPDPEAPLFEINQSNLADHAAELSAGHRALLEQHENYRMRVYPGRRNAFVPDAIYAATKKNATRARLTGTDLLEGARLGIPFPFPETGAEVIWNHRTRYRGSAGRVHATNIVVRGWRPPIVIKHLTDAIFRYANVENPAKPDDSLNFIFRQKMLAPSRVEGVEFILHEHLSLAGRQIWMYRPGTSQVKRMPTLGYDEPNKLSGGLIFVDQQDMFNGPLDRFDWSLEGKREMYMPYNSVRLGSPLTRYEDVIGENHINQELARYERRRVWVVEARLRPGASHAFSRRSFYVDEDSWSIIAVDNYDSSGKLWRVQEAHLVTLPFAATSYYTPSVYYDLDSGRYVVQGLYSEESPIDFDIRYDADHFEVETLQAAAAENKRGFWDRIIGR